jgi:hypothetical protein
LLIIKKQRKQGKEVYYINLYFILNIFKLILFIGQDITIIPSFLDFFNIKSRKQPQDDSFNKDKALFKVLNFIIDNNLSFNILSSDSF